MRQRATTRSPLRLRASRNRPSPLPEADHPRARTATQRARSAGGPDDHALYTCDCGAVFDATVCADVSCPACGAEQTW